MLIRGSLLLTHRISISLPFCGFLVCYKSYKVVILLPFLAWVAFSSCLRPFLVVFCMYRRAALLEVVSDSIGVLQIPPDGLRHQLCIHNL